MSVVLGAVELEGAVPPSAKRLLPALHVHGQVVTSVRPVQKDAKVGKVHAAQTVLTEALQAVVWYWPAGWGVG